MTNQPISQLLRRLWSQFEPRSRVQLKLLLVLMVIASFAEVLSIGAALPFLAVLTSPEKLFEHAAAQFLIQALGVTTPSQLLLPLTIFFGAAALFAGIIRLLLLWSSTRLSFAIGADLSLKIYHNIMHQTYSVYCTRNSSEIISATSTKVNTVIGILSSALLLTSSTVILVITLTALFTIDFVTAMAIFGSFGLIYACIIRLTRKQLLTNSQRISHESNNVIKTIQEGLGSIRDVLIDGNQAIYCQTYHNADLPLRRAQGKNQFVSASPRYAIEALGMVAIAILAYWLVQQTDGITKAIPILGAIAIGSVRLLPLLQQSYQAWSIIMGGQTILQDVLELLDQPLPDDADQPPPKPLSFKQSINLNQLSFRYSPESPYILEKINLTIVKGSHIGFIGTTGCGKSTLLDIIMGLLSPTHGTLEIDGQTLTPSNNRAWQAHLAHVPQTIFLADSTIGENIALGVAKDKIDHQRVRQSAQQAQLSDSIEVWPNQYQTLVGERGIRLSGGQRQRIGIARALYKQADVIIFDEATSALDNETEQAVMQSIEGLSKDLTIIIVAHRLSTLKSCTQIVELGEGIIKRIDTYPSIMSQ
jgi:ABC-type bacteriocin/lantibiotic exporter with double-glycine peptidase domain